MKPEEEELLLQSYMFSASRVLEGIHGNLSIHNSRESSPPPIPPGMVAGLCGQGGRHLFFDIPVQDVVDAMDEIMRLSSPPGGRPSLGQLQSICSGLRQATNFYPASGCVNDRAPRLVPWMPPEEIWTQTGELPLDLWRILSFDVDFLSTTMSAALDSANLSYSSLSQAALAFASLMQQVGGRMIEFDFSEGTMPADLSVGPSLFRCSLMRLFFEAGTLLTPLSRQGDFARWFLAFRYLDWLSLNPTLEVKKSFRNQSVDSRYKGIFSEEIAIGMMAVVLQDLYRVIRINNTAEVSTKTIGELVADFIVLGVNSNSQNIYFPVECKGSLGSPVSSRRLDRAKKQASRTNVVGAAANVALVCSNAIFYEGQARRSKCMVSDPTASSDPIDVTIDEPYAWRAAYAKLLRFVGLERASLEVISGEPAVSLPRFLDEERRSDEGGERRSLRRRRLRNLRERFHCESILDLGFGSVIVDSLVHKVLQAGLTEANITVLTRYLSNEGWRIHARLREVDSEISFLNGLGTGFASHDRLDV